MFRLYGSFDVTMNVVLSRGVYLPSAISFSMRVTMPVPYESSVGSPSKMLVMLCWAT